MYFKGALIAILLIVVAIESIFIVYLIKSQNSSAQIMVYVGGIEELENTLEVIDKNGASYYKRAIAIRLALNKALLNRYIKENKSTIPRKLREDAINVAND